VSEMVGLGLRLQKVSRRAHPARVSELLRLCICRLF